MNVFSQSRKNSLFLTFDEIDNTIECTKIPRNLSRDELVCLIPALWVIKYEKLSAYPQPLKPTDDWDNHYLERPPKMTIYIPMFNPRNDFWVLKDLGAIRRFLTSFMRQHDWLMNFNHKGSSLMWYKCPFWWHYPWMTDCDCWIYKRRKVASTQSEVNQRYLWCLFLISWFWCPFLIPVTQIFTYQNVTTQRIT